MGPWSPPTYTIGAVTTTSSSEFTSVSLIATSQLCLQLAVAVATAVTGEHLPLLCEDSAAAPPVDGSGICSYCSG